MGHFLRLIPFAIVLLGPECAFGADDDVAGKSVKELAAKLKHGDGRVRFQAVAFLYDTGPAAKPLVLDLAARLRDPYPVIRRAAAQTLANLQADAAPATSALVAALNDPDADVRELAGAALREVGEAAVPSLTALLSDKDATARYHAILTLDALGARGDALAEGIRRAVKDANPNVRRAALIWLAKSSPEEAFERLGEALKDKEPAVRRTAAEALINFGRDSTEIFARAAEDAVVEQRILAMQGLARLGENIDDKGLAAVRKGLADADVRVRRAAAMVLAGIAWTDRPVLQNLEPLSVAVEDKDVGVRRASVVAAGKMRDPLAYRLLEERLKDADPQVRLLIVESFKDGLADENSADLRGQLHKHLASALLDRDSRVQLAAARTLASEKERALEALLTTLEKGSGNQRLWSALILAELGPAAQAAVPTLEKMTREGPAQSRAIALQTLQRISK